MGSSVYFPWDPWKVFLSPFSPSATLGLHALGNRASSHPSYRPVSELRVVPQLRPDWWLSGQQSVSQTWLTPHLSSWIPGSSTCQEPHSGLLSAQFSRVLSVRQASSLRKCGVPDSYQAWRKMHTFCLSSTSVSLSNLKYFLTSIPSIDSLL